jgi:protein transport protein SEC24
MRSMSLPATITFLYPRMFGVHDLPEKIGYADSTGRLQLPAYIRGSHAWMVAEGAYLLSKFRPKNSKGRLWS